MSATIPRATCTFFPIEAGSQSTCTIFAFFVQNYAVRRTSATQVNLLMGMEPVFGALFAALWLGESLPPALWLGGALMVAAPLWTTLRRS
jgi:drug/metabolite transporter (DMT)-like permease